MCEWEEQAAAVAAAAVAEVSAAVAAEVLADVPAVHRAGAPAAEASGAAASVAASAGVRAEVSAAVASGAIRDIVHLHIITIIPVRYLCHLAVIADADITAAVAAAADVFHQFSFLPW